MLAGLLRVVCGLCVFVNGVGAKPNPLAAVAGQSPPGQSFEGWVAARASTACTGVCCTLGLPRATYDCVARLFVTADTQTKAKAKAKTKAKPAAAVSKKRPAPPSRAESGDTLDDSDDYGDDSDSDDAPVCTRAPLSLPPHSITLAMPSKKCAAGRPM